MPDFVRGGAFDFEEGREPGPSVDAKFAVEVMPGFSKGFLVGFDFKTASGEKIDRIRVTGNVEVDFLSAGKGIAIEDIFICHDDFGVFVTNTEESVRAKAEDTALHENFGLDELGSERFELFAKCIFVDVEKLSFDFGMHVISIS